MKNIALVCIAILLGAIIFDALPYSSEKYGTLADWLGGLGTIAAFLAVFWQVRKEADVQRALDIENQRPRFAVSIVLDSEMLSKKAVFIGKQSNIDNLKKVKSNVTTIDSIKGREHFVLKNISNNNIYSITVNLKYLLKNKSIISEKIKYTGIHSYQNIVLLTDSYFGDGSTKYVGMIVEFLSSANETGFFTHGNPYFEVNNPKYGTFKSEYFYIKSKNKSVSASGTDRMISQNSKEYKKISTKMENGKSYASNYWKI